MVGSTLISQLLNSYSRVDRQKEMWVHRPTPHDPDIPHTVLPLASSHSHKVWAMSLTHGLWRNLLELHSTRRQNIAGLALHKAGLQLL